MKRLCDRLLLKGLNEGIGRLSRYQSRIRSQMPMRYSKRENHQLNQHERSLSFVSAYTVMLMKEVEDYKSERFCFYQGKAFDELHRVLDIINASPTLEGNFIFKEYVDLIMMAKDHFRYKIAPRIEAQRLVTRSTAPTQMLPQPNDFKTLKSLMEQNQKQMADMKKNIDNLISVVEEQKTQLSEYKTKLQQYEERIHRLEVGSHQIQQTVSADGEKATP